MAVAVCYDTTTGFIRTVYVGDKTMMSYIPEAEPNELIWRPPDFSILSKDPSRYVEFLVDVVDPESRLIEKAVLTPTALPSPFLSNGTEACVLDFGTFTTDIIVHIGAQQVEVPTADPIVHYYTNVPGFYDVSIENDPKYWFATLTIEAR